MLTLKEKKAIEILDRHVIEEVRDRIMIEFKQLNKEEQKHPTVLYREIISQFNSICGRDLRTNKVGSNYKKLIDSVLRKGFSVDDIIRVFEIKSSHWLEDEAMNKYLRLETLLGNRFETYLNEKPKNTRSKFMRDVEKFITNG